MIYLSQSAQRTLTFVVTCAFLFCSIFVFAVEVSANGNPYADAPPPSPVEPSRGSVQRAPIRRPPQRAPARNQPQQQIVVPPQPSSLEVGIQLMEQMRYEQARAWLQRAVQEEFYNPYAWYWFGKAHEKVGQFSQAQFFYRRALEMDPGLTPFARVVVYPHDGDRIPLWDPLRPARIYPVELDASGVTIVPPDAPEATLRPITPDPSQPSPAYVPPGFDGQIVHAAPVSVSMPVVPQQQIIHAAPQPVSMPIPQQQVIHATPPPVSAPMPQQPVHIPPPPSSAATAPQQPVHIPPPPPSAATTPQQPVHIPPPPPSAATAPEQPVHIPPPPPGAPTAPEQPIFIPPPPPNAATAPEQPIFVPPPPPSTATAPEQPVFIPPPPPN